MNRMNFITSALALSAIVKLSALKAFADQLHEEDEATPAIFIGHGSPMNAIEDNEFSRVWRQLGSTLPKPKAILCISAHWETRGTYVTAMDKPKTIHDFGNFAKALFEVQYPALGSKWLVDQTQAMVHSTRVGLDKSWGLDHGSWSFLKCMYPLADIPVVELSLDSTKDAQYHYNLAKELKGLRKKGVMIIGSGNLIHNFKYLNFQTIDNSSTVYDWALEANQDFKRLIQNGDSDSLIRYKQHSRAFQLAIPTPEHYLPMLYVLAVQGPNEKLTFFNDAIVGGSIDMTSFKMESS